MQRYEDKTQEQRGQESELRESKERNRRTASEDHVDHCDGEEANNKNIYHKDDGTSRFPIGMLHRGDSCACAM